jgi:organic hydroperoxide reductase OsmC/OhrA
MNDLQLRGIAMTFEEIAVALGRVEAILQRRPEAGIHDDSPACVQWDGGLKMVATDENGFRLVTDMPVEIGGGGEAVTPGWLLRAGLALASLEVTANSRTDIRGMLDIPDRGGATIPAGPQDVRLDVRIRAPGVPAERLKLLVEKSNGCSPVTCAMQTTIPVRLHIEVDGD